jgi:hypothetical protein
MTGEWSFVEKQETDMNSELTIEALDAISGGKANNGQGEVFQYGVGALVRTGDVGTGNTGNGPFGVSLTGSLSWIVYNFAAAAAV